MFSREKIFKNKSGLTLIEMMMAILIFVIGIAGFTLLFSRTWQINSYTLQLGQASLQASQGLDKLTEYIREVSQADSGAYPIVSADSNDLVVYSDYNHDGVVERLHFYKSGSNILLGITDPTTTLPKTYPAGDQQTITLVSDVVNNGSQPIFSYYNKDYPGDTINNPLTVPAIVSDVRLVKIYLEINTDPARTTNNVEMQTFVEMRNMNSYD
jgi:type II secretory pathway pseudopilin PulG